MSDTLSTIRKMIETETSVDAEMYRDFYYLICDERPADIVPQLKWLGERIEGNIRNRRGTITEQYYLHRDILQTLAPVDFESYMLFMEWNRDIEKQFYRPRQKSLRPVVAGLQALEDDDLDLLTVSLPVGVGKALADDTPILTRKGWKNHGDLVVGDEVIGLNGEFKKVLAVHPKCMLDRLVTFANGEKIQCHFRHEWLFYDRGQKEERLLETQVWEKRKILSGGRSVLQLPHRPHIQGEKKDLPLDPYTLGVWLGDGTNRTPRITLSFDDIAVINKIEENGIPIRWKTVHKDTGVPTFDFNIRNNLQSMGMCHSRKTLPKHIPEEYLTASMEQRLQLLAGLLDTDGTYNKDKDGYVFSTTGEELRDTFIELVSTFGWRCGVSVYPPKVSSSGVIGRKTVYAICFIPDLPIPCVLERKQNVGRPAKRLGVISIEQVEPKQGNCISVEGDGMYLAGKTMLPTHNTTLALFYLTWIAGKHPDTPNLVGSHSNSFIRGCYDECLRIIQPHGEYLWNEVFPKLQITNTNAKDCRLDIGTRKRFDTIQMTSIGSSNAGLYRAGGNDGGLLYCDDLVSGIEVALSKERLDKLWETYTVDLRQRKIGNCKELHIATRWSVHDVIGRLEQEYAGSDRAKFIVIPAMNENDESNFDYPYGVGFTTEMYREQRSIMDNASWRAIYMNEPIEREGLVFNECELRRYFELPKDDEGKVLQPDAIISVCDTKDKGEDFCVMPIAYVYGNDYYIEDCVCDNGMPNVVDAKLINILLKHKVGMSRFESNSAGRRVAEEIQRGVKARNGNTHITTKYTTANKITKIITESKWILDHCLFKDKSRYQRNDDYGKFMNMLVTFTQVGKNKHDDVPDAMAQLAQFARSFTDYEVKIIDRPF